MIASEELPLAVAVLILCIEGFLYRDGKISFLCFNLYAAEEVQLFSGLGIYSGIYAIYIQCVLLEESRTTTIIFYALCLLHVLSTATVVGDLLEFVFQEVTNLPSVSISFFISYAVAYPP